MKLNELKQGQWFKDDDGDICIVTQTDYDICGIEYTVFNVVENDWYKYVIDGNNIDVTLLPTPNYEKLFTPVEYSIKINVFPKDKLKDALNDDILDCVSGGYFETAKILNAVKEMIFDNKIWTTNNVDKFNEMLNDLSEQFCDYGGHYEDWNKDRTSVSITFCKGVQL